MQLMDTDIRHFPESQRAGLCALTSMATTSPMAAVPVEGSGVPATETVRQVQVPPREIQREAGRETGQEMEQETDTTIVPIPVPPPARTAAAPRSRTTGLHASSRRRRPERRTPRPGPRAKPWSSGRPRAEAEAESDFLAAFPPVHVGAGVLLRDDWGCVLLVKP